MTTMTDREIQVAELSQQLTLAYEQLQAAKRQEQLATNQLSKTNIVMKTVEENKGKMYRSLGRMFVLSTPADLKKELEGDAKRIQVELDRTKEMQKNFENKKVVLEHTLNSLTPQNK